MTILTLTGYGLLIALLCRLLPVRFRPFLLLIASYVFYFTRTPEGLPFLLITTLTVYLAGRLMERVDNRLALRIQEPGIQKEEKKALKIAAFRKKHIILAVTLCINFGFLAYFKYANDLLALFRPLNDPLDLILPLGISFYTFQSAAYLFDVSGGKIRAEHSLLSLALYISFFPQLLQGPIGRYDAAHTEEIHAPQSVTFEQMLRALFLILWGLIKKLVIADRAAGFVNTVFDAPADTFSAQLSILAVLLYSLQQYCDFSGGIDLVLGLAEMMGIHLFKNFRQPYFAVSLADFWRRWHITLGSWMRDYIFYPFVLSKPMQTLSKALKKKAPSLSRTLPAAIGNILIFFLVGLWHGATSNYILWGLYNGIILAISALLEPFYKKHALSSTSKPVQVLRILRTFLIVNIGWFFDRCQSGADAFAMITGLVTNWQSSSVSLQVLADLSLPLHDLIVLLVGTALLFLISIMRERGVPIREKLADSPIVLRWLLILGGIISVVLLGIWGSGFNEAAFLYYKF